MDNKKIKYLLITIIALSVLVIGGTFSYFTSTVNTLNDGDTSISTRDIGSIKYTGVFALNSTNFYPGSIGVTKFTIEKDTPTGTGYYEIDLDSVVDLAYQKDIEISLYKTTDEANNNISVTEGNITNANNQYIDTDTLVINGTPELVYGPAKLETVSTLALEQSAFDCETLQPTTYYLVYKYKNNGNQDNQQGKTFTGEVSVRLIDSLSNSGNSGNNNSSYIDVKYNQGTATGGTLPSTQNATYDVSFNLGSNTMTKDNLVVDSYTVTYSNGTATGGTLPSNQTSKNTTVYTADGWSTTSDGTKVYESNQSVSHLTTENNGTFNLYPYFSSSTTNGGVTLGTNNMSKSNTDSGTDITINLNANGGSSTGDDDNKLYSNKYITYTANGWTKTSGSTTRDYANGASTGALSGNLTLYPCFSQGTAYDAVSLPTPSRNGYVFNGWYTASSGGTKVGGAGSTYAPTASTTLYAHWTQKPLTSTSEGVTIVRNGTPYLIKINNWSVEKDRIQQIFSDVSCEVYSSAVICDASDYYCSVYSYGYVGCRDHSTDLLCGVSPDGSLAGSVDCS